MITQTTLQNAARAIECDLWTDPSGANYLAKDGAILRRWEPAERIADAMNLAIRLGISLDLWIEQDSVRAHVNYSDVSVCAVEALDKLGVCWAITRVAAEIGAAL
jgi:hypothetical protein